MSQLHVILVHNDPSGCFTIIQKVLLQGSIGLITLSNPFNWEINLVL
jgi:hypothetical protein